MYFHDCIMVIIINRKPIYLTCPLLLDNYIFNLQITTELFPGGFKTTVCCCNYLQAVRQRIYEISNLDLEQAFDLMILRQLQDL